MPVVGKRESSERSGSFGKSVANCNMNSHRIKEAGNFRRNGCTTAGHKPKLSPNLFLNLCKNKPVSQCIFQTKSRRDILSLSFAFGHLRSHIQRPGKDFLF